MQGREQVPLGELGRAPRCSGCGRSTQAFLPGQVWEVAVDDPTGTELCTFSLAFPVDWDV